MSDPERSPPTDPDGNGFTPVDSVPIVHRLQTRLALLILVVVGVLAGATAIQLTRAFEQARVGVVQLSQPAAGAPTGSATGTASHGTAGVPGGSTGTVPAGTASAGTESAGTEAAGTEAAGTEAPGQEATSHPFDLRAIVRSTLINLFAIFLFTLIGATLFSRRLLTEPINELVRATRELAAGKRGVTLPVTSRSELGLLAEAFNHMSTELAEALDLLERRVRERTADLSAMLELSNSTALTLELGPLLAQILERLEAAVGYGGATVYEPVPGGEARRVAGRGAEPAADAALLARALTAREPLEGGTPGAPVLAVPLVVRDVVVGVLLLTRGAAPKGRPDEPANQTAAQTTPNGATPDSAERRRLIVAFANQIGVALENARLYQRVQERAALEERQHLARELHDSVSQALYAILLGTHTAQRKLDSSPDDARQALDYVENLAQAGIKEMRALIFVLRPESLENEGLTGVLRKQLDVLESRHGIDATLDAPAEPAAPFATKQALYRIAQEALHNVVKHARAGSVRVALSFGDGRVRLTVADDGVGFDPRSSGHVTGPGPAPGAAHGPGTGAAPSAGTGGEPGTASPSTTSPSTTSAGIDHLGLRSMRERARQILGTLTVTSRDGEGTTVTVDAPCDAPPGGGGGTLAASAASATASATAGATAGATAAVPDAASETDTDTSGADATTSEEGTPGHGPA